MRRPTTSSLRRPLDPELAAILGATMVLALLPLVASSFFVNFVATRALILASIAATTIFLLAFGEMASLAQLLIAGVAGFTVGNVVTVEGTKGLQLGWHPWIGVLLGLIIASVVAFGLGLIASRVNDIYYLMLTLVFAVIGFFFFGQVTTFSGFGGINGIEAPPGINGHPTVLYLVTLGAALANFLGYRALARTNFGLALQGIRDDPRRMAALGFNVPLHRAIAFTYAGFGAAIGGVLLVWWNRQIDPASISVGVTLEILIIAVIGGMTRLSGAWLGAAVFVLADTYIQDIPGLGAVGIDDNRFNTAIGVLVLAIVVASPNGLLGLASSTANRIQRLHHNASNDISEHNHGGMQ